MSHIKLLLIISTVLIFSSCKNEKKDNKDNKIIVVTEPSDSVKVVNIKDTINIPVEIDSTNKDKDKLEQDTIKKEELIKVNTLKVVIDDKVYYKKNKNDIMVKGHKTHYYNKETNYYYDIITGRTVYYYGKHGKIMKE